MAATKGGKPICHPTTPRHRTSTGYNTLKFLTMTCSLANLKSKCRERRILVTGSKLDLEWRLVKDTVQAAVYDGRSIGSLLNRVVERKLIFSGAVSSADLVAILEAADLARTFHRFQELPAELRNMVYKYACNDFFSAAQLGHPAVIPAVCQTSRAVRNEGAYVLVRKGR
ncbi:hypothetical protein LTS10_012987 [Elasticomyces elasticus]|nr:hypothetical protein LTS10_012987 [Elasticomyces elasticus]